MEQLIREDVDVKRRERETYGATLVSGSIRARLASPLAGQGRSARLKGDFHIFAFDSQGTVCVYVTSDEERRKWADVVNPRADKDERSGFISALQQWVRSSGLMSGTELDEIVVLTRDEYRVLAKRFSEVPFPRRYLLDHMLGRTRERLEAKWTQREDHVWVWKEREAA